LTKNEESLRLIEDLNKQVAKLQKEACRPETLDAEI